MNCGSFLEHVDALVDEEVDLAMRRAMAAHAEGCAGCADALADRTRRVGDLRAALPVDVPVGLRAAIVGGAACSIGWRTRVIAACAGAAAVLLLAFVAWPAAGEPGPPDAAARLLGQTRDLGGAPAIVDDPAALRFGTEEMMAWVARGGDGR